MPLLSTTKHETSSGDTCVAPITICELCERIDFAANIDSLTKLKEYSPREYAAGWVLGTLRQISQKRATCQLCTIVHFFVDKRLQEQGIEPEAGFEVSLEWINNHFVKGQVVIAVVRIGIAQWITLNDAFQPIPAMPLNDEKICPPPILSSIDLEHILDLRHIEDKLKDCDAHHGRHCQRNSHRAEVVPIFLIDTEHLCLVRSDTATPYFSLSYRWGQTENEGLTRENLDALMRPGGLHGIWSKISRVVRETIQLVAEFSLYPQRYLWVDSLCILQDDLEHKHSQIRHMGTIYHQAAMTIVALSAVNADSALLAAQKKKSRTRIALSEVERQKRMRLIPDYRISTRLTDHTDRPEYIYRSRGWTFQEEKLSRRVLYCTDSGMLFRCRVLLGNRPWWDDDPHDRYATKKTLRTEAIRHWLGLVKDYSNRHFTYPADMLRGFAGIADSLNHPVTGELPLHIVCGVCIEWFPYSLYWRPRDVKAQKRHSAFPTWSWVSCTGAVWFPDESDLYTASYSVAQLVGHPIPIDLGDDTAHLDLEGSSFDSRRASIRKHASAAIALDKCQKDEAYPKQPMAIAVDKFYMLKMKTRLRVMKWKDLGLSVTEFYSSSGNSRWGPTRDQPDYYKFVRRDEEEPVGYTDVAPKVFEARKKDPIAFISLSASVFLVACCVGKDLYERLGVGWSYIPNAREKVHSSHGIVYLI